MRPTDLGDKSFLFNQFLTNRNFRGAYGISYFKVLYINQFRDAESRYKVCKERVLSIPVVIYTKRDFYLLDALDKKIDAFKSAGLIGFWKFQEVDRFLKTKNSDDHHTLTFFQLIGCFYVLLAGCVISFVVLFIEILANRLWT